MSSGMRYTILGDPSTEEDRTELAFGDMEFGRWFAIQMRFFWVRERLNHIVKRATSFMTNWHALKLARLLLLVCIIALPIIFHQSLYPILGRYRVDLKNVVGTIAQVQATIFAIVFGFTVLALETASSRYSVRIPPLISRASILVGVIATYLTSILISLATMALQSQFERVTHVPDIYWLLLNIEFIPIGLFVLLCYVEWTTRVISPTGVLESLAKSFRPSEFIDLIHLAGFATTYIDYMPPKVYAPSRSIVDMANKAAVARDSLLVHEAIHQLVSLHRKTQKSIKNEVDRGAAARHFAEYLLDIWDVVLENRQQNLGLLVMSAFREVFGTSLFSGFVVDFIRETFYSRVFQASLESDWLQVADEAVGAIASNVAFDVPHRVTNLQPISKYAKLGNGAWTIAGLLSDMADEIAKKEAFMLLPRIGHISICLATIAEATTQEEGITGAPADALQWCYNALNQVIVLDARADSSSAHPSWLRLDIYVNTILPHVKRLCETLIEHRYHHDRWWQTFVGRYVFDRFLKPLGTDAIEHQRNDVAVSLIEFAEGMGKFFINMTLVETHPDEWPHVAETTHLLCTLYQIDVTRTKQGYPLYDDLIINALTAIGVHCREHSEVRFHEFIKWLPDHGKASIRVQVLNRLQSSEKPAEK